MYNYFLNPKNFLRKKMVFLSFFVEKVVFGLILRVEGEFFWGILMRYQDSASFFH